MKKYRLETVRRHHNDTLTGWAVLKVRNAYGACDVETLAEFYGLRAKTYALEHVARLEALK